jgi:hypothetical protein
LSKYVEPVIQLQITVPHIAFPSDSQHRQYAEGAAAEDQQRSTEQVRILAPEVQGEALPVVPLSGTQWSAYRYFEGNSLQAGHFRIFQIKGIVAQGRALLLQILRKYPVAKRQEQAGRSKQFEKLRVSDALAFTVEFRHSDETSEVSQAEQANAPTALTPGLHTVVIFLAEDGTPTNFSLDDAKS